MRIFVTGASGYLGSAVVEELAKAGHAVTGLVRSDAGAERVRAAGGSPLRGELRDAAVLTEAARVAEAVAHLGWHAERDDDPVDVDARAIAALGAGLAGSGGRLVVTGGVIGLNPGHVVRESDRRTAQTSPMIAGREANCEAALRLGDDGIAPVVVRLAPSVHDVTFSKPGFVGAMVDIARRSGSAGYPGDGSARWSAVHRSDAARLYRLAIEQADAGSVLHGVAEEGISQFDIARTIAEGLGVPAETLSPEAMSDRFGWLAPLIEIDAPASSAATRAATTWSPTGPGLLQDLRASHYSSAVRSG